MNSFYSTTIHDFEKWWLDQGMALGAQKRLQGALVSGAMSEVPSFHPEVSKTALNNLKENFDFSLPKIFDKRVASDGTVKYLFELSDGLKVESVAISFHKKYTLCLSTQAGCGMACTFCFTGTQGLKRNLESHEIVGQYLVAWRDLKTMKEHKMTPNIVFMGQGEPLHNFNQLKAAIEYLCSTPGLCLGPRQITTSTVGYLPGLERWEELLPVNLAISLHSPFEEERSELIPMNKAYSIDKIFEVLKGFSWGRKKLINFEYLLLGNLNDSREHAKALAKVIEPFPCLVNLIPFNPYPGSPYERPSEEAVESFKNWLVEEKVRTMVRVTKGDEILAACGQLANQFK
ncbi:MAG: 23S rRNA (adenine(2503)-C(2))-methyltransferase RlmN [Bacteriovoracaceae bacterium]|nr:23S rRNA (adenine(2503)-C(2))-methyltransferase RlmN [Bacteriovoracaceae bacterium]